MSSIHEAQEVRWGEAEKQLKGCVATTRIQPGTPAALLHSPPPCSPASMKCCPQPLCCGTHLLVVDPQVPSSKGTVLGQAMDGAGVGTYCKGGGKAVLTQQRGILTLRFALIQVDTRTAPSP